MKVHSKKFSTIMILSLMAFVMTSAVCSAQGYSRSGKTEIFGMVQTVGSIDVKFDNVPGLPNNFGFEIDSTNIYGIGAGFNATDHWNVNMDILFGSADGEFVIPGMVIPPGFVSVDSDYFLWDINVDYNILADRLTPLVTAGIGIARMDLEATIPGVISESSSESNFSYNIGAGGRWDITDNILVKLIYRITWTQIEDANDKQEFEGVALSVAYMF
ncbi:MAG: porin family protein [Planctomycetota bacterium]